MVSMSSQYHNLAICDPVIYFLHYFSVQSQSLVGLNMSHSGSMYSSPSKIAMSNGSAYPLRFPPCDIVDIVTIYKTQ
jgi:homoserine acetyltransferase